MAPALGGPIGLFLHGHNVQATLGQRISHHMPPGGHPDAGFGFGLRMDHRTPRDLPGEKRGLKAGHMGAQHRMQSVRANDQRMGGNVALGQAQLACLDPGHVDASAQFNPIGLASLDQYIQYISAVQEAVGFSRQSGQVKPGQLSAGQCIGRTHRLCAQTGGFQSAAQPQPSQNHRAIRGDLQARANLGQNRGLFQHRDPGAMKGKTQCGGQPTDAAAHDHDRMADHLAMLSRRGGPFRGARDVPAPQGSSSQSDGRPAVSAKSARR